MLQISATQSIEQARQVGVFVHWQGVTLPAGRHQTLGGDYLVFTPSDGRTRCMLSTSKYAPRIVQALAAEPDESGRGWYVNGEMPQAYSVQERTAQALQRFAPRPWPER